MPSCVLPRRALRVVGAHVAALLRRGNVGELVAEQHRVAQHLLGLHTARRMLIACAVAPGLVRVKRAMVECVRTHVSLHVRDLDDV